ncbi:hypothetical protein P280DRAFT_531672 [Massarina eburnea CBS 473.64]|uniref:Uncharacterized protein n=1 Tax=Massarina eburnea CBS 473.64 TaxID=1395130 RepID=A0A6A6SCK8_9PLEO|nr:hypothetical protein P280DRAFT_531672 [Massarina eburnea CBS 473.64]
MSEVDNAFVKRGHWINWSDGPVLGRTITTDSNTGNIIIVLLTVLITAAAAQLWSLWTFIYHQLRATGVPSDGLFWQQQVLLRTFPTPTSLIADSFKLWWTWRRISQRVLLRSLLPVLMALLFAVGSVASSIFSTYVISTTRMEILVQSPHCGRASVTGKNGASALQYNFGSILSSYARDCYSDKDYVLSRCQNTFIKPNVSFSIETTDCPWDTSMCPIQNGLPITLDSGLLGESQFGFNVEQSNRVHFRKKTVCNVLPYKNYLTVSNGTKFKVGMARATLLDERFWLYYFGYMKKEGSQELSPIRFFASQLSSNITNSYATNGITMYATDRYPTLESGIMVPIEEMNRTDADVSVNVIWLNSVRYMAPNSDPLFSANSEFNITVITAKEPYMTYASDNVMGAIGCTEQDFCTSLSGLPGKSTNFTPEASETQALILQLIRDAAEAVSISYGASSALPLVASDSLYQGISDQLLDGQWKKEVVAWESLAWTGIQIWLSNYAVGLFVHDPELENSTIAPSTNAEKGLCGAMKMKKAGGFANINVFGLSFIITFTVTISILEVSILRFLIFLSKFRRALSPRIEHWINDGVFQLQRRVFYFNGQGSWTRMEKEIPATKAAELLTALPIVEPRSSLSRMSTLQSQSPRLDISLSIPASVSSITCTSSPLVSPITPSRDEAPVEGRNVLPQPVRPTPPDDVHMSSSSHRYTPLGSISTTSTPIRTPTPTG